MYSSYSSYGSYSSMSSVVQPMDIAPSSYLASSASYHSSTCAFPSWPRRSSLDDDSAHEERPTSYLSDDDLFPHDLEDDAQSISSGSSNASGSPQTSTEDVLELHRQKLAMQREALRYVINEKERRRQQLKRQRAANATSKKSPKSKQMPAITEAVE